MRYEVHHGRHYKWAVNDGPRDSVAYGLTEAEARIIAFALNAIASGESLYRCPLSNDVLTPYDGPKEGVAP